MKIGRHDAGVGLLVMAGFMLHGTFLGFVLLGAVAMTAPVVLTGVLALKHWGGGRAST